MPVTASTGRLPCDNLRRHLLVRVAIIPCKAKISKFELAICSDKQVVGFQILKALLSGAGPGGSWNRLTR